MIDYNFNFDPVWRDFDLLLGGLLLGLRLAVVALLIGSVIGLLCGYARSRATPGCARSSGCTSRSSATRRSCS